jgi:hypothetical protein
MSRGGKGQQLLALRIDEAFRDLLSDKLSSSLNFANSSRHGSIENENAHSFHAGVSKFYLYHILKAISRLC